jgi:hypothetical protein
MQDSLLGEVDRAAEYVETKIENLGEIIEETVRHGLSYDVTILKDGKEVQHVPVAIAALLAGVGILPSARLISMIGLLGATFAGYTFRIEKKPAPPSSRE